MPIPTCPTSYGKKRHTVEVAQPVAFAQALEGQ